MNRSLTLHKIFVLLYMGLFLFCFYTLLGRFHWGQPQPLPLTYFDHSIPFLIWTFWIYVSYYPFLILTCFLMQDHEQLYRLRNAFFATMVFHFVIFFFFPVCVYRPPIEGKDLSSQIGLFIQTVDAPTNCFPSLHVSLTFLGAFILAKTHKFITVPIFLWSCLIALSTITTRQHYFYDVISAIIVAFGFYILFYRSDSLPSPQQNLCPEKNL